MPIQLPIEEIKTLTNAVSIHDVSRIQTLWSGYGEIFRATLMPQNLSVVVKFVHPPDVENHKYGWNGRFSHKRKLNSYNNELSWYRHGATELNPDCRIARMINGSDTNGSERWLFVLEDLDEAGYPIRLNNANDEQLNSCIRWLAEFHASFLVDSQVRETPAAKKYGLAETGTYWHLATRPEEFEAMPESKLKESAGRIDSVLNQARFQSLVHGDAKLANFCFSTSNEVAAVDFQYVGGGCGMKDLAYFVSSCFGETECEKQEAKILDIYFRSLRDHLNAKQFNQTIIDEVESEWSTLYPFAWADFYRFLVGWSPGHRKIHRYSERITREVIAQL